MQEQEEDPRFRAVFRQANFKPYIFKCKAKNETFNVCYLCLTLDVIRLKSLII